MSNANMDPQLLLFRRQYLQLFEPDFLAWPPKALLRDAHIQDWLYKNLFDLNTHARLPAVRYRCRVLKQLIAKIEQSIEDPEEDVGASQCLIYQSHVTLRSLLARSDPSRTLQEISDDLMSTLSSLMGSELPSEMVAVQQKSYVTFSTPFPDHRDTETEPGITLLERRNLISGSQTTGFRTWEAALHLGSYLLTPAGKELVRGKSVLELGAGTGFLSIQCAGQLQASHVTTTDGDEGVVDALKENLFLNDLDDGQKVLTSVLRWGHGLAGSWVQDDFEEHPYDTVIGADIVSACLHGLRYDLY